MTLANGDKMMPDPILIGRNADKIEALARAHRMPHAIEPLHPMYAADHACVNTLEQALDLCDWLTPTTDLLNDRGMMGDGVIDIRRARGWVEAQGFAGYSEVEIFSTGNSWLRPHEEVLDTCIARHKTVVRGPAGAALAGLYCTCCSPARGAAAWATRTAVPDSTSPESWPPSSMTTLP